MQLFYVFVGSGVGGVARHAVSVWMGQAVGTAFPYGTITVNAVGSFCIALIMHVALSTTAISADMRLFLATGVMGGFTTYSTFNYEMLNRFQEGAWLLGSLNLLLTVMVCLVAGALGFLVARALVGT